MTRSSARLSVGAGGREAGWTAAHDHQVFSWVHSLILEEVEAVIRLDDGLYGLKPRMLHE